MKGVSRCGEVRLKSRMFFLALKIYMLSCFGACREARACPARIMGRLPNLAAYQLTGLN